MGADVQMTLERWGWYPRGGGRCASPSGGRGAERGAVARPGGKLAFGPGPRRPTCRSTWPGGRRPGSPRLGEMAPVEIIAASGQDRGSLVFIWGPRQVSVPWEPGANREQVADEAVEAYLAYRASGGACDRPLADQMLSTWPWLRPLPVSPPGRHLASAHQRLGHRAVPGAEFSDQGSLGEREKFIVKGDNFGCSYRVEPSGFSPSDLSC